MANNFFIHPSVLKRMSYAKRQYKKRLIKHTSKIFYFIDTITKTMYYSYSLDALISYLGITEDDIAKMNADNSNFELFTKIYNAVRVDYSTIDRRIYTLAFFRAKDIFSYLIAIIPSKLPFTNMQTLTIKPINSSTFRIYHKTQLVIEFTIDRTLDKKYTYFITRNPFNLKL